ncbi:two-component system regulatory protein YycI [Aerococcus sp. UMB8608]|uniref:two-component system regulatory protein YycI n=1 Tax=unclassified Aerococcus TaxID=2618060 RepID=UPI002550E751|nr:MULTISPECIES: two-component system regulatory protein YycI [unclassified Aerococcus]MDK6678880.1 two-component system regulatory protein YycI [Aerococcus sp. UMB8608]MDK6939538.1 two-component system regulatory protein YycI [Aerococcus sp. UMB8487]
MDFRRIQYILIVAFLILDLFLLNIFVSKNSIYFPNDSNRSTAASVQTEMNLNELAEIPLSDEAGELPFVAAQLDLEAWQEAADKLTDQEVTIDSKGRLFSKLDRPLPLPALDKGLAEDSWSEIDFKELNDFKDSQQVLNGKDYHFAYYNPRKSTVTYYQEAYDGHGIIDGSGDLIFHLNDKLEVDAYEQSYAGETQVQGENRPLISEKQAIENLYLNDEIPNKASVVKVKIGYRTSLALDQLHMYKPIWTIYIKHNDDEVETEYVDGINGTIIQPQSSAGS